MAPEQDLAAHWSLLSLLVGIGGGAFTVGVGVVIYTARIMNAIDNRVAEKILLSLSNGAGERVREIAHTAVVDAMNNHALQCPLKARLESLEDERG